MFDTRTLNEFSHAWEVLEVTLNAYCQLTSNENIYDDDNDRDMSIEDCRKVIAQLKENNE